MDKKKFALSGAAAFIGVCALPQMMGFTAERIYLTNTIYSVLAWIGLFVLIRNGMDRVAWGDLRENLIAFAVALCFSVCMAVGSDLDSAEYVAFGDGARIAAIFGSAVVLAILVREAWSCLGHAPSQGGAGEARQIGNGYSRRAFGMLALALLLCWLPVFLASYPGFFVYDAQDEVNEVLTRSFSTHHPLLHVLWLGGTVAAVHKLTGSYNLGIACFMAVQMGIAAYCFVYMLDFLKRHGVCRAFRAAAFWYLALFPVIPMYVLCSSKDTLFTIALLVLVLLLYGLTTDPAEFFGAWRRPVCLMLSIFFMMSFRHNGLYAFLAVLALFIARALRGKKGAYGQKAILVLALPVLLYFGASALLAALLQADTSESQEMLTVPIMQLTRVHETDGGFFSGEEKAVLYGYLPKEAMACYTAKLSDNVKVQFNNEKYASDPAGFWELWLKAGRSHIGTYVNAWLYTSYGFWYPDTVIDAYGGIQRHTFQYGESSYFGYETEPPGTRESVLPWLDAFYRKLSLEITQQKIPVVSMLFSPGFLFWVFAFAYSFFWKQKQYDRMLVFGIVGFLWLTVLLGPVCMVRYVLIFWFALPVLCAMLFEKYTGFV